MSRVMPAVTPKNGFMIKLGQHAVAILKQRLQVNAVPSGFDPLSASASDLAGFFLPPKPDAARAPRAFAHWKQAMSPPLVFCKIPVQVGTLFATVPSRSRHLRHGSSWNWSGAYVRPGEAGKMMLVQGAWSVPKPSAPKGSGDGTYASSIWVGFDGYDPASRTMPQIGTGQYVTVANGKRKYNLFAWWQWLVRDAAGAQIIVPGFPVNAGDEFYAQIEMLSATQASFFIKNLTSGLALSWWYSAPPPTGSGPDARPVLVEGRTAEWIVERPANPESRPDTRNFFTMADYGSITFTQCNAGAGTIGSYGEAQLQRAQLIPMNAWDDPRRPGALVSKPTRIGTDSLGVSYMR